MKLEKKCVFYHGLGGEPNPAIVHLLNLCGYDVLSEHIDFYEEWFKDKGNELYHSQLEKIEDADLLIGNSFGGYVAYLMGKATGKDVFLINPGVNRDRSVTGIGHFNIAEEELSCEPRIEVFLGEHDDVVPKEWVFEFFKNSGDKYTAYIVKNMDHGIGYHDLNAMFQVSELVDAGKPIELLKIETEEEIEG